MGTSSFDVDLCLEQVFKGELLTIQQIKYFCDTLKNELMVKENICHVAAPVTVVGDIHGQFYDLIEMFKVAGSCPDVNYLFLGDYVDRGYYSVKTISLLICLKVRYPERITLLRGNHETRQVTQIYGFYSECMRYYGTAEVWESFVSLFDYFRIAAIVSNSIFCVHGGLSPDVEKIQDIVEIDRFREIPHEGAFADLMWSDPDTSFCLYKDSPRGCGYLFGKIAVKSFLKENKFTNIVRAHQLCVSGYEDYFDGTLTTIWSAPNYCYRCGNDACVMEIDDSTQRNFNFFLPCPDDERQSLNLETNHRVPQYFL